MYAFYFIISLLNRTRTKRNIIFAVTYKKINSTMIQTIILKVKN